MEDVLDHWPDLIFGIHEFDGSIEVERVQEDVGHGANMAVVRWKYIDIQVALHGCSCLDAGKGFFGCNLLCGGNVL